MASYPKPPEDLDLIERARWIHNKCMLGEIDPRTGETQRKAALDVLTADFLKHLSTEDLAAEIARRAKALDVG